MKNSRCSFIVIDDEKNKIILNREYISHIIASQNFPNTYIINMSNGDEYEIENCSFEQVKEFLR